MENLKAIAQIVSKINLKFSDFLITDRVKPTNTDIFYKKIISSDFQSDADASQFFFNTDISNGSYRSLKHSLKEKLINTLFFIDPSQAYSDQEKAFLYCNKNLCVARILIQFGARDMAKRLLQKVFARSIKFELTDFIVQSSKILRSDYAHRLADTEKFNFYNKTFKEYRKIQDAENTAQEYYALIVLPYLSNKTKKKDTYEKATQFHKMLQPYLAIYSSPFLHLYGNLIKTVSLLSINDYPSSIKVCRDVIHFFEQKPYSYKKAISVFLHEELICYIQLKDWEKGKVVALKAINNVKIGGSSWYINQELRLMLALHSKEYTAAYFILNDAINHHKFRILRASLRERWLINKAYISFLIFIGKITTEEREKKKFKVGKFLNSVPIYSKDKRGLNIPILILQILFMIVKKDYSQSIDRFEAIKKYCSRYLRDNDNLRSNCFINMLLQIPISNFHKAGVERRAKKYYDKLLATPLDIASQGHEIEIIPYEDLWAFVMESLDTKFYKV